MFSNFLLNQHTFPPPPPVCELRCRDPAQHLSPRLPERQRFILYELAVRMRLAVVGTACLIITSCLLGSASTVNQETEGLQKSIVKTVTHKASVTEAVAHLESIHGTVGQSVLLPFSYTMDRARSFRIQWSFAQSRILFCVVNRCSISLSGIPGECNYEEPRVTPKYQGRVQLFPKNASLILKNLTLNDSGVYTVALGELNLTRTVALSVLDLQPGHATTEKTQTSTSTISGQQKMAGWVGSIVGVCSALIGVLSAGALVYWCHRARATSNAVNTGNVAGRDIAIDYAIINQPRVQAKRSQSRNKLPASPEYSTVNSPRRQ